jgi:hypothetical protein
VISLAFYHGLPQAQIAALFEVYGRTIQRRWQSAHLKLHRLVRVNCPNYDLAARLAAKSPCWADCHCKSIKGTLSRLPGLALLGQKRGRARFISLVALLLLSKK